MGTGIRAPNRYPVHVTPWKGQKALPCRGRGSLGLCAVGSRVAASTRAWRPWLAPCAQRRWHWCCGAGIIDNPHSSSEPFVASKFCTGDTQQRGLSNWPRNHPGEKSATGALPRPAAVPGRAASVSPRSCLFQAPCSLQCSAGPAMGLWVVLLFGDPCLGGLSATHPPRACQLVE